MLPKISEVQDCEMTNLLYITTKYTCISLTSEQSLDCYNVSDVAVYHFLGPVCTAKACI